MSVADELAIRRTLAQYCHGADNRDLEQYCGCFTDDGEMVVLGNTSKGHDALAEFLSAFESDGRQSRHINVNHVIDIDGDRARSVSDFLYLKQEPDGTFQMAGTARYYDELVRDADRWLIARRTIGLLGEAPPEGW